MISVITDEVADNVEDIIQIIKKTNVKWIELRKINKVYLYEINAKELEEYKNMFDNNDLKVSMIDSPIGKHKFIYQQEMELLKTYINICKIFNCNKLRIFSDVGNNIVYTLKEYNDIAKDNNIILYIENEPKTYGENYNNLLEIMNNNYSNIKVLYDPENYYSCNINYIDAYKKLYNYIDYIHLRDIKEGKYVYLTDGEINIKRILEIFKDKIISLETHLPMVSNEPKEKLFLENIRRINE